MTVEQVMDDVLRDVVFYDESGGGVTFSGGEPLLQGDFLLDLLRACKAHDLHTVVDTCGFASPETLDRVRPYVDLFLYDLKLMDDDRHRVVTGASNRLILDNLRRLAEHNHPVVLRVPVIPGINDDEDNLRQIGASGAQPAQYHPGGSSRLSHAGYGQTRASEQPESDAGDGSAVCGGDGRDQVFVGELWSECHDRRFAVWE